MANIKSAKKRIKVIDKKTARNIRVKNHVKDANKAFLAAVNSGNVEEATKAFQLAEKKLMQAAAKGTFHKNAVSRTISRFEKKLNAMGNADVAVKADASMKKDELLAIAKDMGIEVAAKATKADILAAIEAK